jgi:hypothetical protein
VNLCDTTANSRQILLLMSYVSGGVIMMRSVVLLLPLVLRIFGVGVVAFSSPLNQRKNNINIRHAVVSTSTTLFASENVQLDRRSFATKSIASITVASALPAALITNNQSALADDDERGSTVIIDPSVDLPKITNKVYLDIKFGNYKAKRLVIGLFGDVMPKASSNFLSLCSSGGGDSYEGTTFYRVISDMTIQGK